MLVPVGFSVVRASGSRKINRGWAWSMGRFDEGDVVGNGKSDTT